MEASEWERGNVMTHYQCVMALTAWEITKNMNLVTTTCHVRKKSFFLLNLLKIIFFPFRYYNDDICLVIFVYLYLCRCLFKVFKISRFQDFIGTRRHMKMCNIRSYCTCKHIKVKHDKMDHLWLLLEQYRKSIIHYTVELVQSDILWHLTNIYGPKVFLLTKIKPEYSNLLYNLTYFPGPLVCRIR